MGEISLIKKKQVQLIVLFIFGFLLLSNFNTYSAEINYYQKAQNFEKSGNEHLASVCYIRCISEYKPISDYFLYRIFLIARDKGNISSCRKITKIFKKKYRESRWYEGVLSGMANMLLLREEYGECVKIYSECLNISKATDRRAEVIFKLAEAYKKEGKKSSAKKYYLTLWKNYPFSPYAKTAEDILAGEYYGVKDARDKFYLSILHKRAKILHQNFLYKAELTELEYIIRKAGNSLSKFVLDVTMDKGRALERLKDYRSAAKLYDSIGNRIKKSAYASKYPFFLYRETNCYLQLSDEKNFLSDANEMVGKYKNSSYCGRTYYLLYTFYKNRNDYKNARFYLDKIVEGGSKYFEKSDLLWKAGFLSYEEGDYSSAIKYFRMSSESAGNDSKQFSKALFWTGKSAEKIRLSAYAQTMFKKAESSDSYYGWLSRYRVDGSKMNLMSLNDIKCRDIGLSDGTDSDDYSWNRLRNIKDKKFVHYLERSFLLNMLGDDGNSVYELNKGRKLLKNPDRAGKVALASLLVHLGGYREAIDYLRTEHDNSLNILSPSEDIMRIVYPFAYYDEIARSSKDASINPFFVMALIRQESFFNPAALSTAGAVGLMQVMPSTAEKVAGSDIYGEMLYDYRLNISIGVKYLSGLMGENGRNPYLVLPAYNAGEKKLAEWKKKIDYSDPEYFTEKITYGETREYIKKVMTNFFNYMSIYCGEN